MECEKEVEKTYNRHVKAYENKLAPKPGELVTLTFKEYKLKGYTVQIAKTRPMNKVERAKWRKIYHRDKDDLYKRLTFVFNMDYTDIKERNCGIINNHLVCLDFGSESFNNAQY